MVNIRLKGRITRLFTILLVLGSTNLQAQSPATPSQWFDCPIPMETNGNIGIFHLIDALSICAGVLDRRRADTLLRTEIIDFGTYAPEFDNPKQPTQMTGFHHDSWEREIPLAEGLIFGLRVHFSNVPAESEAMIEVHIIHPKTADSAQGDTETEVSISTLSNGQIEMAFYQISAPDEIIPGIWTFEVHYQGMLVALKNFKLLE